MSNETEGVFTFTWNIGEIREFYDCMDDYKSQSPIVEAETLKGTKWFLKLYRYRGNSPGYFKCDLCRPNDDKFENILETYKLDLIDEHETILKSVAEANYKFPETTMSGFFIDRSFFNLHRESDDDSFMEQIIAIRCHIIEVSCKVHKRTPEITILIHLQWKITTPGPDNWSKVIKVPFNTYSHTDIIMTASDKRINIKIEKVDLLQPYKLKVIVLSDENRKINCNGAKYLFVSTDENKNFETWIEKSELVDKSLFHLPYSFTLVCTISTYNKNSVPDIRSCSLNDSFPSVMDLRLPLQEDLKKMLLDDKHSDVKLRSNDKLIPAHKCLLSARSPVFSTMFDQDMLETQTGIVDIPDVDIETLQSFLEFLYTETITNTDCNEILKLMLVADKYQVDVLKELCSQILITKLSIKNICEVASVAEMVNHSELKLASINFIRENKKEIISSSIWSEWMKKNMELATEILMKLIID